MKEGTQAGKAGRKEGVVKEGRTEGEPEVSKLKEGRRKENCQKGKQERMEGRKEGMREGKRDGEEERKEKRKEGRKEGLPAP